MPPWCGRLFNVSTRIFTPTLWTGGFPATCVSSSDRSLPECSVQWAPAFKTDPVKKLRLDLSEKIRNSVEERQLKIGNKIINSHIRKSRFQLPMESYSTDEGATAGAWVLLEAGE